MINEFRAGALRLHQVQLNGTLVKTFFEQEEHIRPAVDFERRLAVGREGLIDLATGALTALPQAKRWTYPEFVRGKSWIVSPIEVSSERAPPLIEIFDYRQRRLLESVQGYWPSLGPAGELLFLRAERDHVDVMRHAGGKSRRLKRIEVSERLDVNEVVALGGDDFLFRASHEHGHRYYRPNDEPYYPSEDPTGRAKEQFDFALSSNGAWAAFAERNWNELTYLVTIDLQAKRREQTPFYGSFPAWSGDRLLFASDPEFVRTEQPDFRQIETFAVYSYQAREKTLCRVATTMQGDVIPYGP